MNFVLESRELKLNGIFECQNFRRAVVKISNDLSDEHIFVVWDLEK